MAENNARKAVLRVLIDGVLKEINSRTIAGAVYMDETYKTTLVAKLAEMVAAIDTKITNDDLTTALTDYVRKEAGKGLSAEDFTAAFKAKLEGIAEGAQVNVIESISVNGTKQTVTDKGVDIKVPTKVSELSNDKQYTTVDEVNAKIAAVYKPAGSVAFASLPTAAKALLGNVYNLTDAFVTTDNFVDGAGKSYPAGTNVVVVEVSGAYKYDVLAGFVDLTDYAKRDELPTGALADKDQVAESDLAAALAKKINDADTAKHTHANKTVLDGIDAANIAAWNAKARVIVSATQPDGMTENDLWLQPID